MENSAVRPSKGGNATKRAYLKRPRDARPAQPQVRPCLRCQATFTSTWSGERICAKCKASNAWRESGGFATF